MIRKIAHNIYLSNQQDVHSSQDLKSLGIDAILNVAADHNDPIYPAQEFLQIKVGLMDNSENNNYMKDLAVQTLKILIDNKRTVLVHCVAGASRSPYVILRYLAETEHRTMDALYKEFQTQYPEILISPLNYVN